MTRHKKVYKSRLKLRKLWAPNGNIKTRPEAKKNNTTARKHNQETAKKEVNTSYPGQNILQERWNEGIIQRLERRE